MSDIVLYLITDYCGMLYCSTPTLGGGGTLNYKFIFFIY